MDKLVITLNARLGEAEVSDESRRFFADGGGGGFETAYAFVTQPMGIGSKAVEGDPLVLWRAFPGEWTFARKPTIGTDLITVSRSAGPGGATASSAPSASAAASSRGEGVRAAGSAPSASTVTLCTLEGSEVGRPHSHHGEALASASADGRGTASMYSFSASGTPMR